MFKVIEGGLYGAAALYAGADQVSKLRVEGQRRLQQADLEGFEARERVTGIAIPHPWGSSNFRSVLQSISLSQLSPLPARLYDRPLLAVVRQQVCHRLKSPLVLGAFSVAAGVGGRLDERVSFLSVASSSSSWLCAAERRPSDRPVCPGIQRAVTGDLVMLDRMGGADQPCGGNQGH